MLNSAAQTEEYERFAREVIAAWNSHDPDRIARLYADNYVGTDVSQADPQYGPQGIRATATRYLEAFPDLVLMPEETVIQDNRIAVAFTARGTHTGPMMNIPPTGRAATIRGVSLFTLTDGKITRALHVWDVAGFLRSIGLLPELYPTTFVQTREI